MGAGTGISSVTTIFRGLIRGNSGRSLLSLANLLDLRVDRARARLCQVRD
jgi:hypothetical protein